MNTDSVRAEVVDILFRDDFVDAKVDRILALLARHSATGEGQVRGRIFTAIEAQIDKAYAKHGRDPWGRHEFYGVLKEEVDEVWDAIKTDAPVVDVLKEALQVACVCVRYLETGDRYQGPHPETLWTTRSAAEAAKGGLS